ncbi:MAG: methionyl-tRNA formyltransferase [Acidobacteriota bacterium]|nr:methionyl-tRNA formyltransferase [Acidobacteriota bacterium]
MRLVFMGTPDSAVPTLRRCLADGHEIVAVWTQPDRPAGRGNKLHAPPVKQFALEHDLTIHQPEKIKTEEARELFASHEADAAIIVAYGRILPSSFLHAPHRGCINVHFSLLPKYRGAAPVNWAIVRGERETGVTTMRINEGLDTGPIYLQHATLIGDEETAPQLLARLSDAGAELLSETLARLDEIEPRAQREDEATHAPILRREDGLIDWRLSASEIERRVRGFQPFPTAFTVYKERRLIIWQAIQVSIEELGEVESDRLKGAVEGEVIDTRSSLVIACGGGTALALHVAQLEGKQKMVARDLINGVRLVVGEILG